MLDSREAPRMRWVFWLGSGLAFAPFAAMAAEPAPTAPIALPTAVDSMPAAAATTATIRGRVVDTESQHPVQHAEIAVAETALHAMSDRDGGFVLQGVPPGTHTLRVTRLGYETTTLPGIAVVAGAPLDVELRMVPRYYRLKAITVTPGTYSFMKSATATHQTMTREDIESVPAGEDIFRAINRLPGLASGDYAAHFSIRGGRHDETLILFDGLELYEPYHLKDFDEGALSIIDVETVDGVELMTGGFPAQYGNKRSGVFDITSRTPDMDKTRYSLGLSFLNARASVMGPLGGKGSWLASGRSGYMDLVFGMIQQDELPSPRYHDFFAKMQTRLSASHRLAFEILYAGDKYKFDAPSTTGFQDSLKTREKATNSYGNAYAWTTLNSVLGAKTAVRTMASAGLVTRSRNGYERYYYSTAPLYTITNNRDFSILGLKQDWTSGLTGSYVLTYGFDVRRLESTDRFTSLVEKDPNDPAQDPNGVYPITSHSRTAQVGTQLGVYLSNRVQVVDPLVLELGVRYDGASYTKDGDFSPRTGAALRIGSGRTLRLGWGIYRQMQGIDDVAALNNDNRYYPSERSEQWTAGVEQRFRDGGSLLRVEGFYKEGSELRPVYRNWKGGIDTFPEVNEDRILVYPSSTKIKGVELYYDHKLGKRLAMRASYAYSIADEWTDRITSVNTDWQVTFDTKHSIPKDQRHAANVDFTYRMRKLWSLTGSLAMHSGWPATLEEFVPIVDEDGEPDVGIRPQKLYAARLPDYYRFDMRATRRWTTSHGDFRFFMEMINLTNHSNIFGYDYFRTSDSAGNMSLDRDEETWFTILPSVGIAWSSSF